MFKMVPYKPSIGDIASYDGLVGRISFIEGSKARIDLYDSGFFDVKSEDLRKVTEKEFEDWSLDFLMNRL